MIDSDDVLNNEKKLLIEKIKRQRVNFESMEAGTDRYEEQIEDLITSLCKLFDSYSGTIVDENQICERIDFQRGGVRNIKEDIINQRTEDYVYYEDERATLLDLLWKFFDLNYK